MRYLWILFCIVIPINIFASQYTTYKFRTISPRGGLGFDGIKSIVQDDDGFMWFLMGDDIYRFDGYNFQSYSNRVIVQNNIAIIFNQLFFSQKQQRLYLATSQGLFVYRNNDNTFTQLTHKFVNHIYEDDSGTLWLVGTDLIAYSSDGISASFEIEASLCCGSKKGFIL